MTKNLLLATIILAVIPSCKYLNKDRWKKDYYKEKCILSNYHSKWEDKNCSFRLVKVDPGTKKYPIQ